MSTPAIHRDFRLHLPFAVPAEKVFTALSTLDGAKGWWTHFCKVSEGPEVRWTYDFPGSGFFAVMKVIESDSPSLLEWECTDSMHHVKTGYHDLRDWIGTRIRFEIRDLGNGKSQLDFTHFGLNQLECIEACSSGWSFFLSESLRGYLENGEGKPWDQRE